MNESGVLLHSYDESGVLLHASEESGAFKTKDSGLLHDLLRGKLMK